MCSLCQMLPLGHIHFTIKVHNKTVKHNKHKQQHIDESPKIKSEQ